jgi:Rps23 Pro-64 3,4-dihydroxylase Tpa1-like proline 4-hydroxylase
MSTDYRAATLENLKRRAADMRAQWSKQAPFPYFVVDDFLPADFAEELLKEFPPQESSQWTRRTYTHQREKLTMTSGFAPATDSFFRLSADPEFLELMSDVTGIQRILADPELVGGGLHQIAHGGFLDVHIDFNLHPRTKLHRRMNLLLYLNKDWRAEYEGKLELWDMEKKRRLESLEPIFNRAILFETNEVSYHGHPMPLAGPKDLTRKSAAVYYYTETRTVVAAEHNTMYRQTTGIPGYAKTLASSARAFLERTKSDNAAALATDLVDKAYRRLRGLPPRNG